MGPNTSNLLLEQPVEGKPKTSHPKNKQKQCCQIPSEWERLTPLAATIILFPTDLKQGTFAGIRCQEGKKIGIFEMLLAVSTPDLNCTSPRTLQSSAEVIPLSVYVLLTQSDAWKTTSWSFRFKPP